MNTIVALCAVGAERILGNEIKYLGYKLISNAPGRVSFSGDDDALFRSNLCLRTADRVYLQAAAYPAEDFDDLFAGAYSVNWQDYFKKNTRIVVDKVRIYKSKLNSEHSVQSMVQKAVYKKLGDVWKIPVLPETGEKADIRVYMDENTAVLLLDLSGLPLHKRGYRADGGIAPLRETTAAVLLQMMMWRRKTPLHDPFCGSGTIPIEAALYAYNVAPGLGRNFAIENLAFFDQKRALQIRKEEAAKIRTDVEVRITGSDIDPAAIERSAKNAEYACVTVGRALQLIGSDARIVRPDFVQSDFKDLQPPYPEGLILCNPPYGERLGDEDKAEKLYKDMAVLFRDFKNWRIGVITSNKKFQELSGFYASSSKELKAGNLDTRFFMFKECLCRRNKNGYCC
ncbi:class I SAM-dependent RNA methyltransferase [Treponema parvum]|uniref:Class I SAM-dependent RNA methyltransferase n=1 Tax=Treponema parvum TaxID=138851 RepID=A0A975IBK9_9SPIR|nr:class I SAM-dependent RNA methyltransferase [Treponema parvum]QTQ10980.1 class I SAM-dependent RNA methyltransferase [Treponema parvum]